MQRWSSSPNPAPDTGWIDPPPRKGFFTDSSVCIGCKACEVACKEWNGIPEDGLEMLGMSYDNTGALGASTWRHVAFIEQPRRPTGGNGFTALPMVAAMSGAERRSAVAGNRYPVVDVIGRVQALHARSLPRCVPDRAR